MKVRIKKLPEARTGYQVQGSLINDVPAMGGADYNAYIGKPKPSLSKFITAVPREEANLEAEGGETVYGDLNGDGMPEHKTIKGPRHHSGGVPLALPDDTFIFSDTQSMKIKDPKILAMFGKSAGKSYTPAALAKQYDLDNYRKILQDPDSDKIARKTAELMIKNYNMKLGALALAQESKKGFPQGIPAVAQPYMGINGITEEQLIPQKLKKVHQQFDQMYPQTSSEETMESPTGLQDNEAEALNQGQPVAEYGMSMGVTSRNYMGRRNTINNIPRAEDGKEVTTPKQKVYTSDNLPADAVVRDRLTIDTKPGDFIKQPDGTYLKVSKSNFKFNPTADTRSLKMSASEFKAKSPENAKLINDANTIIEKGIKDGTIISDKNGNIKITGKWSGDFKDRITLSKALNATNAAGVFGTDKYKIISQGATGPYSKLNEKTGKLKGSGSFVAGFTPELYEQRFVYERAKGLGMSDEEAFAEAEKRKNDPAIRRQYLTTLGVKDIPTDDKELMSPDFYKKHYADITQGIERVTGASDYRPAIGNEQLSGFEHFDALGFTPEHTYEQDIPEQTPEAAATTTEAKKCPCQKMDGTIIDTGVDPNTGECNPCEENIQVPGEPAPWWLQDTINTTGAFGDLMSIKKYMPWAPGVDLETPRPTFLDPTRELAAQAEQANIQTQGIGQFAGSQAQSARATGVQGEAAKQAANTLSQYNNANVNLANQFEFKRADVANQEQMMKQAAASKLYDQNTIANQQFDNSKMALRNNLRKYYTNAITNRAKTDALNQLYPQYAVDPSTGGFMHFTKGKDFTGELDNTKTFDDMFTYYKSKGMSDENAIAAAKSSINTKMGLNTPVDNKQAILQTMYQGDTPMAGSYKTGGFVFGNMVFPFNK